MNFGKGLAAVSMAATLGIGCAVDGGGAAKAGDPIVAGGPPVQLGDLPAEEVPAKLLIEENGGSDSWRVDGVEVNDAEKVFRIVVAAAATHERLCVVFQRDRALCERFQAFWKRLDDLAKRNPRIKLTVKGSWGHERGIRFGLEDQ
jgi:hypothetical protein